MRRRLLRYAAFAAPVLLVGALALLLGAEAGPRRTAAATPVPDAGLKRQCIDGAAVGTGNDALAADCALLLEARNALSGAVLNWSTSTAIADWTGVTSGGTPQRVTELSLQRAGLEGSIAAQLGGLGGLQSLRLNDNSLEGSIPAQLGSLGELRSLHLSGNDLRNAIPAELGNLGELRALYLDGNELSGAIPGELANLRELTDLVLDGNGLTGGIPAQLGSMPRLQYLYLEDNSLEGAIPPELGNAANLRELRLSGNGLTGGIPAQLGRLWLLQRLQLEDNSLEGAIPAQLGNLGSLRVLRLQNNELRGEIPAGLGELGELVAIYLGGNSLTGCIPHGLADVGSGDLDTLGLGYCEAPIFTLATAAGANGSIEPAAGMHSYSSGTSVTITATPDEGYRVASWGGDCAASGTAASCLLTIDGDKTASVSFERQTYTLTVTVTGEGGSVSHDGAASPYHGDEVTLRASWDDATHGFTGWGGDCAGATGSSCLLTMDAAKSVTATFTALPANRCAAPTDADCIRAVYLGAPADYAQVTDIPASVLLTPEADGRYYVERGHQITVVTAAPLPTGYTRFWLDRTPLEFGTPSSVSFSQLIPPVGTTYTFTVAEDEDASTLITFDLTAARPFVRPRPDGKPELGDVVVTTVFSVETSAPRYDTFDTTGEVTAAGSYAFVSDTADTATAVTTYDALRDGTTTGLLIHQSDAHGASQVALYDAVEAGDLLEWHETDDCFVRYQVNEVMADPTGTPPRKLFAVEWTTYAFTGCSGAVPAGTVATVDSGELPDLGGTGLTAPVVHGIYQLVPAGWTGETEEFEVNRSPGNSYENPVGTTEVVDARQLPYWRDPALPEGWVFGGAGSGGLADPAYGYCARYLAELRPSPIHAGELRRFPALDLCGYHADVRLYPEDAAWRNGAMISETRTIAGRPARVIYSPPGPNHDDVPGVSLWIYDAETESEYFLIGVDNALRGDNVGPMIAIARSLFEGE